MFIVSFVSLVRLMHNLQIPIAELCRFLVGLETVSDRAFLVFHGDVFYQVYHLVTRVLMPTKARKRKRTGEKLYTIFARTCRVKRTQSSKLPRKIIRFVIRERI